MNKLYLIITAVYLVILSGCGDGVPKVDDPHNPIVDGVSMKPFDFLKKYCNGKQVSETCQKVRNAMATDSTKGTVNRF